MSPQVSHTSAEESHVVGLTLRLGAYVSIGLVIAGLIAHLWADNLGMLLMKTGVLCLMFTPVVRIAVAVIVFAKERDRRYVAVSVGVLIIVVLTSVLALLHVLPAV